MASCLVGFKPASLAQTAGSRSGFAGAPAELWSDNSKLAHKHGGAHKKKRGATAVLKTPHSGYHYDGTPRRFFEGWYFRVTIPEVRQSLAWMYSIEDPYGAEFTGVGAQIMGPDDSYLCQFSTDLRNFWASRHDLQLGNTFKAKQLASLDHKPPRNEIPAQDWQARVSEGFQVSTTWHQGCLHDDGRSGSAPSPPLARWEYSTRPVYGWGNASSPQNQKSTAGWLAALPVFEPHWQILMSHGLSTGWVEWGRTRYEFKDAPSYSEKNWGGSFPKRWFWIQCNAFKGMADLAVTVAGGRRGLPLVPGLEEDVALVGVHTGGKFYEFVPWTGSLEWEVAPWGLWTIRGITDEYEVVITATCEPDDGTVLRAPTADKGLSPFCRQVDTFFARCELSLWRRSFGRRGDAIVNKAVSDLAAVEVGGGPWWTEWRGSTEMQGFQKALIGLPLDPGAIPGPLRPPGI
eukprot:jgi/Chlat1/3063/Chrsp21S03318